MAAISLLLPTRGRPKELKRLLQSLATHSARLDAIEVILYFDEDDPTAASVNFYPPGLNLVKIVGPRRSMGDYNSACLNRSTGEIVMLMNDDVIIRTPNWDQTALDFASGIPDGVFLAYPNDLHMGRRMCTFPILSRKACDIMGRPYPREYRAGFIDWHLFDVFKRLKSMGEDRIYFLKDLIFEHRHYMAGKSKMDPTYQSKDYYGDDWTFVQLLPERIIMARRLCAAIRNVPLPSLSHQDFRLEKPRSDLGVLLSYARIFLFDSTLFLGDRVRVCLWLTGRYLRQRRYLPPKGPSIRDG